MKGQHFIDLCYMEISSRVTRDLDISSLWPYCRDAGSVYFGVELLLFCWGCDVLWAWGIPGPEQPLQRPCPPPEARSCCCLQDSLFITFFKLRQLWQHFSFFETLEQYFSQCSLRHTVQSVTHSLWHAVQSVTHQITWDRAGNVC